MVWGAFSAIGMGPLKLINGKMTGTVYRDILSQVMMPFARRHMPADFIFQQDNDPKHTCNVVKKWFVDKQIKVMD